MLPNSLLKTKQTFDDSFEKFCVIFIRLPDFKL